MYCLIHEQECFVPDKTRSASVLNYFRRRGERRACSETPTFFVFYVHEMNVKFPLVERVSIKYFHYSVVIDRFALWFCSNCWRMQALTNLCEGFQSSIWWNSKLVEHRTDDNTSPWLTSLEDGLKIFTQDLIALLPNCIRRLHLQRRQLEFGLFSIDFRPLLLWVLQGISPDITSRIAIKIKCIVLESWQFGYNFNSIWLAEFDAHFEC